MLNTDALLQIAYNAAESGDFDLARQCYERGAYFGDPQCLQALGYMHDVGEGVPRKQNLGYADLSEGVAQRKPRSRRQHRYLVS